MHIPDGFVSLPVNAATMVATAATLAVAFWRTRSPKNNDGSSMTLAAMMASFVFAAQMLNFPIGGGTSGHFLGGVAIAALLGPWSACLMMALVLTTQAFFFADGGVTALGSNIMNMGIIGGAMVYPLMRTLRRFMPKGLSGYYLSAGAASWIGIVLASAACAIELALSGTTLLSVSFPAMVETHAIIGVGEAAITVAALATVAAVRPSVLPAWALLGNTKAAEKISMRKLVAGGLAVALALAVLVSPFASGSPDGLEKIATDQGFLSMASATTWAYSLFPDYQVSAITAEGLSTGLAGFIGTLLVFAFGLGLSRLTVRSA
ncbi:MAG: energy-coupling factor ABC transporter permease [Bdellovibrionales bacterium]|jgi:cobalt/nickel transport system permease protein